MRREMRAMFRPSPDYVGHRIVQTAALVWMMGATSLLGGAPEDVPATSPAPEQVMGRPVTETRSVAPDARSAIKATLVLKVGSKEKATADLLSRLESAGGYFTQQDQEGLKARVPRDEIRPLIEFASSLGVVVQRGYEATDVGAELERQRSRLEGREGMLTRYEAVLKGASASAIVSVEREITRLIEEIEGLKGSIRFLEHQIAYSELEVRFQFQNRAAPVSEGSSSFKWLNTVNLTDLVSTFRRNP